MKKIIGLFLIVPFLLGAGLKIKEKVFDAGKVIEGKPIIHEFTIQNTGSKELLIKKVMASCGCTTVSYDKTILPGKKGKITLKVRTSGYQGKISKRAMVYTNDPEFNQIPLTINAFVKPLVKIEPRRFIYVRKTIGEKATSKIFLSSELYPDFKILKLSSFPEKSVKIKPSVEKGKRGLEIIFPKTMKIGQHRGSIIVKTDIKDNPMVRISYFCQVEGVLKIVPNKLTFYKTHSGINYRVISINSKDKKAKVKLKKCPENFKCFLNKVKGGYIFVVAMEKVPVDKINNNIELATNIKGEEKIKIELKIK